MSTTTASIVATASTATTRRARRPGAALPEDPGGTLATGAAAIAPGTATILRTAPADAGVAVPTAAGVGILPSTTTAFSRQAAVTSTAAASGNDDPVSQPIAALTHITGPPALTVGVAAAVDCCPPTVEAARFDGGIALPLPAGIDVKGFSGGHRDRSLGSATVATLAASPFCPVCIHRDMGAATGDNKGLFAPSVVESLAARNARRDALPGQADVVPATGEIVCQRQMSAAALRVTVVRSTGVGVITVKSRAAHARLLRTIVVDCAGITVVTGKVVGAVDTTNLRVTRIIAAEILIVTIHGTATNTLSVSTHVEGCA